MFVGVAQLVEQRDHNPQVVGSNPTPDTNVKLSLKLYNFMYNRNVAIVAQLVRAPACHVGGCRFKSGRSRPEPYGSFSYGSIGLELCYDFNMDKLPEQISVQRDPFVSFEDSQRDAQELLAKYESAIHSQINQDVNGWNPRFPTEMYQNAIEHYLDEVPPEILENYHGHGITRGRELEWLTAAINILANRGVRGDVSRLAGGRYIDAYREGSFLVVLEKDNPFPGGKPQKPDQAGLLRVNLGALIVNTQFYPMVDELRTMFPNRTIIKASEIPQYFADK